MSKQRETREGVGAPTRIAGVDKRGLAAYHHLGTIANSMEFESGVHARPRDASCAALTQCSPGVLAR